MNNVFQFLIGSLSTMEERKEKKDNSVSISQVYQRRSLGFSSPWMCFTSQVVHQQVLNEITDEGPPGFTLIGSLSTGEKPTDFRMYEGFTSGSLST